MKKYLLLTLLLSVQSVSAATVYTITNHDPLPVPQVDVSTHATSSLHAATGTPRSENASVDANVNASTSAQMHANDNANLGVGSSIEHMSVMRPDVDNTDSNVPTRLVSPDNVANSDDLHAYAVTALKSDANLKGMVFDHNMVTVSYPAHGHFLGLIPVTFVVDATADADGNVTLSYPWYKFLVTTDLAKIQTALHDEGALSGNASTTALFQADLAARLYSILKMNFEATTTAGVYN